MTDNNIIDINLEGVHKSRFRINGDNDSILELNISDVGIFDRLNEGYARLQACVNEVKGIDVTEDNVSSVLKKIDNEMRKAVDFIFDSNVSEVCCKGGTMVDPINGGYRFEKIIDGLTSLYTNNINEEYKKLKKRVNEAADIPQDHKKKDLTKSQKRRIMVQKEEKVTEETRALPMIDENE